MAKRKRARRMRVMKPGRYTAVVEKAKLDPDKTLVVQFHVDEPARTVTAKLRFLKV